MFRSQSTLSALVIIVVASLAAPWALTSAQAAGAGLCGNAILDSGETCDDGNALAGDGCSQSCQVEAAWSCTAPGPGTPVNALADGDFEADVNWVQSSTNFANVICDRLFCGHGTGSEGHGGEHWLWIGGYEGTPESSAAEQFAITIPPNATTLSFRIENTVCDSASDFASVLIDGNEVYRVDGADATCGTVGFRTETVDLVTALGGPYNDGSAHVLRIEGDSLSLNGGASNFFFDDLLIEVGDTLPEPSACSFVGDTCYVEDFDPGVAGDLAALGWTVFNTGTIDWDWGTTDDGICGSGQATANNVTGGAGEAACVDSDAAGYGDVNAYLCSPALDLLQLHNTSIDLAVNYQVYGATTAEDAFEILAGTMTPSALSIGGYDSLYVTDVDAGAQSAAPGEQLSLDFSAFDGESEVYVCLRYSADFDWYAQMDDFALRAPTCESDLDVDGIADSQDNCMLIPNADQRDTDGDGIGSICDGDFNQSCVVNFLDLGFMKADFFAAGDLNTDMNGSGTVNFTDLALLKSQFFGPPGPSGIPNICDGAN